MKSKINLISLFCILAICTVCSTLLKEDKVVLEVEVSHWTGSPMYYPQETLDIIEDSIGNTYEISFIEKQLNPIVRKRDPSGLEIWANYYKKLYVQPVSKCNTLTQQETKLALVTLDVRGFIHILEIDAIDGNITKSKHSNGELESCGFRDRLRFQCGIAHQSSYAFFSVSDQTDYNEKLVRVNLENLEEDLELSEFISNLPDRIVNYQTGHYAFNENQVAISGYSETSYYSIYHFKLALVDWSATPSVRWAKRFLYDFTSSFRLTATPNNSKVISVSPDLSTNILVITLDSKDGSFVDKALITTSYSESASILDLQMFDEENLFICVMERLEHNGTIISYNIANLTTSAYTATESRRFFYSLTGVFSDGFARIAGGDNYEYQVITIKYDYNNHKFLSGYVEESSQFTAIKIPSAEYDPIEDSISYNRTQSYTLIDKIFEFESSGTVLDASESITFNIFRDVSYINVNASTTGGKVMPEQTWANVTDGLIPLNVEYSLIKDKASLPNWLSINKKTGEISYNSPDKTGKYSFIIRVELFDDLAHTYDTKINLKVVAAEEPTLGNAIDGLDKAKSLLKSYIST